MKNLDKIPKRSKGQFITQIVLLSTLFLFSKCHAQGEDDKISNLIVGKWRNEILVPPSTEVYVNNITFSGNNNQGTFVDQNSHIGSWTLSGDSITWVYENVPGLQNTFKGKISADRKSMVGINYGIWNGDSFKGSWAATKE